MNIQPPAPKRSWKRFWLILAGIFLVLAAIGALTGNHDTSTATTDQSTSTVPAATQAPTSTPTLQPTVKTLTTEQRTIQIAQDTAHNASKQPANVDSTGNLIVPEFQDIPSITSVKVDCFNVLQALLTAKLSNIHTVDLEMSATLTDANGNQSRSKKRELGGIFPSSLAVRFELNRATSEDVVAVLIGC